MDARSSVQWEIGVAMELRKTIIYELDFCGDVRNVHTFAIFRVTGPSRDIIQFSDYLQSGLPDLRDEFIDG
jgi:hypothetical protein